MTESGFDQSASAVATKRPNSAVGGGRSRSLAVWGGADQVRESTRSAESSASSGVIPHTCRDADQVRGRDTEAVEHAGGVSRSAPCTRAGRAHR